MKSINTLFRVLLSYPKTSNLFAVAIILSISFFLVGQSAYAQCVVTGMTPSGGEIVSCSGTDNNGLETTDLADDVTIQDGSDISAGGDEVVHTRDGDDKVQMNGGTVSGNDPGTDCIELGSGNDEFHMVKGSLLCEHGVRNSNPGAAKITIDDGIITASDECINTRDGSDEIYINGGELTCDDGGLQTNEGNETIIITGGRITQTEPIDQPIRTDEDDDLISISNATIDGRNAANREAINAHDDNDTVKVGTGAEILGIISGGDGYDTLVFEMDVPEEAAGFLCSQIFAMDPEEGSITINNLLYEWNEFELFVCDLQPVRVTRPIPTLSEWGLLTMAGILGIAGILAARRKKIFA